MKRLGWMYFWLQLGAVSGQTPLDLPDAPLWLIEAWEAECLELGELAMLRDVGLAGGLTQQAVVMQLGTERSQAVLPCLMALVSFQSSLKASMEVVSPRGEVKGTLRLGRTFSAATQEFRGHGRFLHWDKKGGLWRARMDQSASMGLTFCAAGAVHRSRGKWVFGTMTPRFGQGLVMWANGAFDDLGGMEGSHRIPLGLSPAAVRLRGSMDGVGWQRHSGARAKSWAAPGWMVLGRIWSGAGWTGAIGGGRPRLKWALRMLPQATQSWRGLVGFNGRGQHSGWSWRWALAGFQSGWVGRWSLLRSWTSQFEGHALMVRDHPHHPGWRSGEWRTTLPDSADVVGWMIQAGLAWKTQGEGWLRWRWRKGMKPTDIPEQRWAFRWEKGHFRSTLQLDMSDTWDAGFWSQWAMRVRWAWRDGGWPNTRWRLHVGVSGEGESQGGVLAVSWAHHGTSGSRWSAGVGQAWGATDAPVRYVTGWNDRPAQAFGQRKGHLFFRHQSPSGHWHFRGTMALVGRETEVRNAILTLQGLEVEFRWD